MIVVRQMQLFIVHSELIIEMFEKMVLCTYITFIIFKTS